MGAGNFGVPVGGRSVVRRAEIPPGRPADFRPPVRSAAGSGFPFPAALVIFPLGNRPGREAGEAALPPNKPVESPLPPADTGTGSRKVA